jgi:hypothetical protein
VITEEDRFLALPVLTYTPRHDREPASARIPERTAVPQPEALRADAVAV